MGRLIHMEVAVPAWIPVLIISVAVGALWWIAATAFMDWLTPKIHRRLWHRAGLEGDPPENPDHWLDVGRWQLDLRYNDIEVHGPGCGCDDREHHG